MTTIDRPSGFTSDRGRARFLAAYDRAFTALWPVPVSAEDVPTSLGVVRAYRAGPSGPDPVVLLSGAGGNALGWYRHVAALSAHRPVLAVDPLGEPGRSVPSQALADGVTAARWLDEVLAAVGAERAHLVGSSYGGWIALEHERHLSGRVSAVTLVDPAGLADLSGRFYRWVILGGLSVLLPRPLRHRAARALVNGTLTEDELMRLGLAARSFRRRLPAPPVWTDPDLAAITTPVQLLLGARSALHDSTAVARRIATVAPSWRTEVVPATGHALPLEAPGLVVARVLAFHPTRAGDDLPDELTCS
ncbi:alpha/beta fold hydrolase [Geodermatophilus ruber]|uniref:Pimeloyl-ACP methyl ester carboxylesterase n=1 Tax=Geodermatophilus ruber TaxID=504800 RepID=A0A1I3YHP6_9ACTN|nr:alpha/beta fold hydrolase [Geodermatophilus ruber]SFK31447.1 Pimeloyl-ACP methyl ester carboxylesterase [Geodermatophilus ruber]